MEWIVCLTASPWKGNGRRIGMMIKKDEHMTKTTVQTWKEACLLCHLLLSMQFTIHYRRVYYPVHHWVKERHKTRRSSSSWTIESLFQSIVKRSSLSSSASSGHGRHQWYSSRTHETSGSIIILQTSVRICNREMISEKFSRQNYNHLWKDRQGNWIERKLHESLMRLIP